VRIRSTGKEGTIVRAGKKGTWIVQVRAMKFPVPEDDLELLSLASERSNDRPDVHASVAASTHAVPILDIRGARMDEAIDIVERQIDSALLSGMYRFSIIHGTGEGVLQTAVRNLLKQHPHVSRFGYASPEEGGYGKTEVELT
jgi:DNA mismatch repair protein MutS2